ncbi:delta-lactam-biosynthetic de-N-acetylase [Paenibacillus pasadenensis]|uniref:Polysaccharide deacetylase n=1 Tax=Paenibacillus pasadenensis TaxID=217090 RepID=A0A2N5N235_9BACL|nr:MULTISPECIES: delta-lactam-biosynthetic de-N-acetylase [Paenibacillus]PLT44385.1 Polysaccharide deacetylase [Paenibacillus pasadenensis]QGG54875.1 delta-lactam-biosynthetic de-N-acetylase [Paenibacillus sp. B01]
MAKRWWQAAGAAVLIAGAVASAGLPLGRAAAEPAPPSADAAPAAGWSKAYHFGFKKSKNGELPSIAEEGFQPMLEKHGAVFLGDTSRKELYLTFDNGYEKDGLTGTILDVLKEKNVPAIFFITGHYVKTEPELVKRMAAEGHLIGNHSWSHPDMSTLPPEKIRQELADVKKAVAELTGVQKMDYLRAPRGIFSEPMLAASGAEGYRNVFWSVAYKDWDTSAQRGADYAYRNVMEQLHPGAVLLLHAVSSDNTQALGRIIDGARAQGYEFKSLDGMEKRTYR